MVSPLSLKKRNREKYSYKLNDHVQERVVSFKVEHQKSLAPIIFKQLECILYCSRYAQQLFLKHPELFLQFETDGEFRKPIKSDYVEQELYHILQGAQTSDEACAKLRYFRHAHHLRILVNDLLAIFSMQQTMKELSNVSDLIIRQASTYVHHMICKTYSLDPHKVSPLTVIAMGKLGGQELNFSSDIDLIFGYPEDWTIADITAEHFYSRQAKLLIKLLSHHTEDGFVYRVDLRLRPFGEEGAVVLPYSGFENYYQRYGRPWERYALIKARIIYGDKGHKLEQLIHHFVYNQVEEASAIETLRKLKLLIEKEVLSRQLQHDIKRGLGGIRQVEFFVQLFQLVYGFDKKSLQTHQWYRALKILKQEQFVSLEQFKFLKKSYYFLREIEHYLQIEQDKQTHTLPRLEEEQIRLACCMGYSDWESLDKDIQRIRREVNELFENLLRDPQKIHDEVVHHVDTEITKGKWRHPIIHSFVESDFFESLDSTGQSFCIDMINCIYQEGYKHDDLLIDRLINLLGVIADRESYIILFRLHSELIYHVINLFNQSPWCARNLKQFPSLLHELASMKSLSKPAPVDELADELRQMMLSIPEHDTEQISEALRKFKLRQFMKVAYSDMSQTLPLMKVSDHLTFTAEAIVRYVYLHVVRCMIHENPQMDESIFKQFAIIAYGKLGGIELSYQSDLDLVFLHDGNIEYERYYIRMAQRIISLLEKPLRTGKLYDVDTRLRPSGQSGLLSNSYQAFEDYLTNSAWTWEHQALIRARFISGGEEPRFKFDTIRRKILSKSRDIDTVRNEVYEMRERLRRQTMNVYNLESYGKVVEAVKDIEFVVQFLTLAYANEHTTLLKWSDNIRILEEVAKAQIIPKQDAEALIDAYYARSCMNMHSRSTSPSMRLSSNPYNLYKSRNTKY